MFQVGHGIGQRRGNMEVSVETTRLNSMEGKPFSDQKKEEGLNVMTSRFLHHGAMVLLALRL